MVTGESYLGYDAFGRLHTLGMALGKPQPSPPLAFPNFHNSSFIADSIELQTTTDLAQNSSTPPDIKALLDVWIRLSEHSWMIDINGYHQLIEDARQSGQLKTLDQHVRKHSQEQWDTPLGMEEVLRHKMLQSPTKRFLLGSVFKKFQQQLQHPDTPFELAPWDARKAGLWESISHFVNMIQHHPLASSACMGVVILAGYQLPIFASIATMGLCGVGIISTLYHEWKATTAQTNSEKTQHLMKSGESISTFLMTLPGIPESWILLSPYAQAIKGLVQGERAAASTAIHTSPVVQTVIQGFRQLKTAPLKNTWELLRGPVSHTQKPGVTLVTGLLDDALAPLVLAGKQHHQRH